MMRIILISALAFVVGCASWSASSDAEFISVRNALELIGAGRVAHAFIGHDGFVALRTIDGQKFRAKEPRGYPLSKALRLAPNAKDISVWVE